MASLSQNITQAISDLASIKTALESKGVTVPQNTPTSQYAGMISNIPAGNDAYFIALVEGNFQNPIMIPEGTTKIGKKTFYELQITSIVFPSTLRKIEESSFTRTKLVNLTLPDGLTEIEGYAFSNISTLTSVNLPHPPAGASCVCSERSFQIATNLQSLTVPNRITLGAYAFTGCTSLRTLVIENPTFDIYTSSNPFYGCTALEFVTLPNNYDGYYLDLSVSTQYSAATIVSWLNALRDRTGVSGTVHTVKIGSTNLAKLTAEEIAIATNKNWNLV